MVFITREIVPVIDIKIECRDGLVVLINDFDGFMYLPRVDQAGQKSFEELLEYVVKMRVRGDDWRAVRNYLNRYSEDDELKQRIINSVDAMEKDKEVITPETSKSPTQWHIILGGLVTLAGVALTIVLWEMGWIFTLSFFVIGLGIAIMSGTSKNFMKQWMR